MSSCTETKTKNIPAPTPVVNQEARDYDQYTEKVWSDEFDGFFLDESNWVYEQGGGGWGNQELQNYTNSTSNAYVSGGNLVIQARKEQSGSNAYTSARLITKGKKTFQFGRIDVRAKIPKGKGVWPAIWMLGADIDQNNWPKCGEIDIMELRGSKPKELISTMHYATSTGAHGYEGDTKVLPVDLSTDFHIYSVVRSENMTRFYLDGNPQPYYTYNNSTSASPYPFNNGFFLILNVAVGGHFDGNPDGSATFPQQMQVDYVRYYQYK
ncbi:glycoside hydrolase family 16 protein [Hymenobacter sediminis]|uniref:glycoside hydrolase family 16 protein n=1 Tax=Hymenobacter sediminis TaxID=2218621 RepID=UPI00138FADE6|nr:glycoside hydrolase family 16 protein [Hymenobacter sediminis]